MTSLWQESGTFHSHPYCYFISPLRTSNIEQAGKGEVFGVGRSYLLIQVTSGVLMLSEKGSKVTSAMASVRCVSGMYPTVYLSQETLFLLDSFRETVKDGTGG